MTERLRQSHVLAIVAGGVGVIALGALVYLHGETAGRLDALETRVRSLEFQPIELPYADVGLDRPLAQTPGDSPERFDAETLPADEPSRDVQTWVARLADGSADTVFTATVELAQLGDRRAAGPLAEVLREHDDFYARLGAATALGALEAHDAVPDLIAALDDKDDLVRAAAFEALFTITRHDGIHFVSGAPLAERAAWIKAWRDWWRDNETRVRNR